ncbi:hypothetical protein SNE40_020760 [Patella caerulea]|uniref:Farnesoic acid O-methyl transferase domain-containing protein n=1 Tax=Patella caerulea TaxID=87958 RepID=A0AAN8J4X0_PATCE
MAVLRWPRIIFVIYGDCLSRCDVIDLGAGSPYTGFRNIQNQESELVWMKGRQDAIIGLFESTNISSLVFELLIGGFHNSRTGVRVATWANFKTSSSDGQFLLNHNQYTSLWIKWRSSTVYLKPGTMDNNGPVLKWTRDDIVSVRYMAFRTGTTSAVKYVVNLSCSKTNISI